MSVIFRVVGANETVKDLLNKDLKVVSKSRSATGSVIFNIKNDDSDSLLLLAFTEKYNRADIDGFVSYLKSYKS